MDENKVHQKSVRLSLRKMSLGQRLPILICILLLSIIITFSAIAYYGVKKSSLAVGHERLRSLTDQLSGMFQKSTASGASQLLPVTRNDSIKEFVVSRDDRFKATTFRALESLRRDSLIHLVELLDTNGKLVLNSYIRPFQLNINRQLALAALAAPDSVRAGRFYKTGDSLYYPVVAVVRKGNEKIGYLVRWHYLYATPQTLEQLSQLMGTHATLHFGNDDGSMWTDLNKEIDPPPAAKQDKNGIMQYTRKDGKVVMAAQSLVPGTPWILLVEFSKDIVLSPADRFLYWMLGAGVVIILIGITVTAILSRNITKPLKKLTTAVSSLSSSHSPLSVETNRRDEIGQLARAFNGMSKEIASAHTDLEKKVEEAQEMNEQLRNLSAYIQNIREEERMHIAREMHDELGQLLTAFKMDAAYLRRKLPEDSEQAIKDKITSMLSEVDEAIHFVRKLSTELRPQILDDLGLVPALEWFSIEFTKRYNIDVIFYSEAGEFKTSSLIATSLFRMFQESLTNVARHSGATTVESTLSIENEKLVLTISDNGKGFDTQTYKQKKSLGLLGLKERALMINGTLEIISAPGRGTTVHIEVPIQETKAASTAVTTLIKK